MEHMPQAPLAPDTGEQHHADAEADSRQPGRVPAFARPGGFAIWLVVTGLVGAVASFLLLYERVQLWNDPEHVSACDVNPWVSCGEVMGSWQAATFGFP